MVICERMYQEDNKLYLLIKGKMYLYVGEKSVSYIRMRFELYNECAFSENDISFKEIIKKDCINSVIKA